MPSDHAERVLQPSQFKRTLNCPGWGQICDRLGVGHKASGKYAAEGTAAHMVCEWAVTQGKPAAHYLGQVIQSGGFKFTVDAAMAEAVQVYVDEITRLRAALVGATFQVESRLDLGWLVPGMKGTGDHVAVEPLSTVHVHDYKHGAGVAVEVGDAPGDNPQLAIYALGALGEGNPHMAAEVVVSIVQPRAPHHAGSVRSVKFSADALMAWGTDVLAPAAQAAKSPGAPLCAGDWCRWCDAEDQCPELRSKVFATTGSMFPGEPVAPPAPEILTGEQLGRILAVGDQIDSWLVAVRAEAFRRLEHGQPDAPVGYKLVEGKLSNRAWADEGQVYEAFKMTLPRAEVYEEKLQGPVGIERALKAKGVKPKDAKALIEPLLAPRTPGKPFMVPETDARPALPPAVDKMFPNE